MFVLIQLGILLLNFVALTFDIKISIIKNDNKPDESTRGTYFNNQYLFNMVNRFSCEQINYVGRFNIQGIIIRLKSNIFYSLYRINHTVRPPLSIFAV